MCCHYSRETGMRTLQNQDTNNWQQNLKNPNKDEFLKR